VRSRSPRRSGLRRAPRPHRTLKIHQSHTLDSLLAR
jgi:hypothetical protein